MRLNPLQSLALHAHAQKLDGAGTQLGVFGARQDDAGRGGDLDFMLDLDEPAENSALLTSRILQGRKVDVLISTLNLHGLAYREGQVI